MRTQESQFVRGLVALVTLSLVSVAQAEWLTTAEAPGTTQAATSTYDNYSTTQTKQVVQTLRYADGRVESYTTGSSQAYLANDLDNWLIGRPSRLTATALVDGGTLETKVTAFEYNNVNRPFLLTAEIKEPDLPEFKVLTSYGGHDAYGHPLTQSLQADWAIDPARRVSQRTVQTVAYDQTGIFPAQTSNALGHTTSKEFDPATGLVKMITDPNGLVATNEYDVYGRVTKSTNPDGTYAVIRYEWCTNNACPEVPGSVYRIVTEGYRGDNTLVSPAVRQYFDMLGRPLQKRSLGFDGREQVLEQVVYNARGQVEQTADTYFVGETIYWSRVEYDALSRPVKTMAPDGSISQLQYNGNRVTSINAVGQRKTEVKNVLGKTVDVIENDGNKDLRNQYVYDSLGRLKTVTDAKGNLRSYEYDFNGNKIVDIDPGSGRWEYTYNTLGQLLSQKDAKGSITKTAYDELGRVVRREEPELISTWTYDTKPKLDGSKGLTTSTVWKGMLHKVTASNGYQREYSYDLNGRLYYNQVTVDNETYLHVTDYDTAGRPNTVVYPGGKGYRNVYNGNGFLEQVQDVTNSNVVYWRANAVTAKGQVTRATLGNGLVSERRYKATSGFLESVLTGTGTSSGISSATIQNESYQFDAIGNLKVRTNSLSGLTENFGYDNLNRLKTVAYVGGPMNGKGERYNYDEIGNLVFKSGAGTLAYQAATPSGRVIPHAVSSVTPGNVSEVTGAAYNTWALIANGGISFPIPVTVTPRTSYYGSKSASYQYDENGRMTSGDGRTVSWTSWGMPDQISQNGKTFAFTYTAEHERIKKTGNGCSTLYLNPRIDLGGRYELETCGTKVTERWTLYAGGSAQGEYVTVTNSGVVEAAQSGMQYFHTDHLGSVVAVTNATGQLMARMSYDAWGLRRNFDGTPLAGTPAVPTTRGFTSHEMLDDLGLVHMNGRLYDPVLGRFVRADPTIDGLFTTQGLNQFSYVHNNPLSLLDPSGYGRWGRFKKKLIDAIETVWAGPFSIQYKMYRNSETFRQATIVAGCIANWGLCGLANATYTYYYTNSWTKSIKSGGESAAWAYVGEWAFGEVGEYFDGLEGVAAYAGRAVAHGVVGGGLAELQGGDFKAGFASAFVSAAFSPLIDIGFEDVEGYSGVAIRTGAAMLIGGVASEVGGGEFAKGALIAGLARIYNHEHAYLSRLKQGNLIPLGNGFYASIDRFNGQGGQAMHEFHIYRRGTEVGLFKEGGFFHKHGMPANAPAGFEQAQHNRLKGLDVQELRAQGRLGAKGTQNVKGNYSLRIRGGGGVPIRSGNPLNGPTKGGFLLYDPFAGIDL